MNNKKIIVRAYVNENLGDDLFLKILFERYEEVDFFLIDVEEKNCTAFERYSNVHYISFKEFFRRNREFDGYIDIGGSIFIQEGKGLGGFKKRFLTSSLLKLKKKPTFILGANFGPYNAGYFRRVYKYYFKFLVQDVCFRDQASYELFSNLKNVRYAPDIVFQLLEKEEIRQERVKNSLAISVMDIKRIPKLSAYYKEYVNKLVDIIDLAVQQGQKITLVSFCDNQGDINAINDIISKLGNNSTKVDILQYEGNIETFLRRYSSFENAINLRFHSFILSLIYKQNLYPLIYSKKTMNVIEDLGTSLFFSHVESISSKDVGLMLQEMDDNNVNVKNLINESTKQFKLLDQYIKGNYEHKR